MRFVDKDSLLSAIREQRETNIGENPYTVNSGLNQAIMIINKAEFFTPGDLVRKSAVQEVFRNYYADSHHNPVEERLLHLVWKDIKSIETAPVGTWSVQNDLLRCPYCGYIAQYVSDKYCGDCGARLKGADDGTS